MTRSTKLANATLGLVDNFTMPYFQDEERAQRVDLDKINDKTMVDLENEYAAYSGHKLGTN